MLSSVGYWLNAVPLGEPWRAIVSIAEVLAFAFILHWLWELGFVLVGRLRQATSGFRAFRDVSASRPDVRVPINPAWQRKVQPTIKASSIPTRSDEVA